MAWLQNFVAPQDPRMLLRSLQSGRGGGAVISFGNNKLQGVPDAPTLRSWTKSNGFIKGALSIRRNQIATADWDVIVVTPELPKLQQRAADAAAERARTVLDAPNPNGKNNSFAGLLEPLVDDFLTLGVNTAMKTFRMDGSVAMVEDIDAARLRLVKGWRSNVDGPRYVLMDGNNRTGKYYTNDQLVTMFYEPTSYEDLGTPPLRSIHSKLVALQDAFESTAALQANRVPPTFLNLAGMDDDGLERMRRILENELLGQSMVGLFSYPIEDVSKIELANMNLQEQGVAWFVDWMLRETASAFRVSTMQLGLTQDVNRSTASAQIKMALDEGVIPVMKVFASYINREIISTFGNPNIRFVWTELVSTDEPVDAAILEKQSGPLVYMSMNELRIAAGLHPKKVDPTDPMFPWWNDGWVPTATGTLAPLSVAAKLPEYQPAVQQAATNALLATHNRTEQDAKNPPDQQPAKALDKTLSGLMEQRAQLLSMVRT